MAADDRVRELTDYERGEAAIVVLLAACAVVVGYIVRPWLI